MNLIATVLLVILLINGFIANFRESLGSSTKHHNIVHYMVCAPLAFLILLIVPSIWLATFLDILIAITVYVVARYSK